MVTSQLSKIVRGNIREMTSQWLDETLASPVMKTYQSFDREEVRKRGQAIFENLIKWLESGAESKEVETYFRQIGQLRFEEGFPLTEVYYAVHLTKKIFWGFVDWRDAITGKFETSNATQIMSVFNDYFDLGNFHIASGYFNGMISSLDDSRRFSKSELKQILLQGKKEFEEAPDEEFIWRHV